MIKCYIEWCTNYNGVYIFPFNEDLELSEDICDAVADTLPSFTYDHLSETICGGMCDQLEEDIINKSYEAIKGLDGADLISIVRIVINTHDT